MRTRGVSRNPGLLVLVALLGTPATSIVFGLSSWLVDPQSARGGVEEAIVIGGVSGLVLGVMSLLYVLPLLTWTDTRKSIPLTYGGALACACVFPMFFGGEAFGALVISHLALCILSALVFRRVERKALECPECGYDLRHVEPFRCPECGWDPRRPPK